MRTLTWQGSIDHEDGDTWVELTLREDGRFCRMRVETSATFNDAGGRYTPMIHRRQRIRYRPRIGDYEETIWESSIYPGRPERKTRRYHPQIDIAEVAYVISVLKSKDSERFLRRCRQAYEQFAQSIGSTPDLLDEAINRVQAQQETRP
jgi:hypothetical protein